MAIKTSALGRLIKDDELVFLYDLFGGTHVPYGFGHIIQTPSQDCSFRRQHPYSVKIMCVPMSGSDSSEPGNAWVSTSPEFKYVQIPHKKSDLRIPDLKLPVMDRPYSSKVIIDSHVPLRMDNIPVGSEEYVKRYFEIVESFSQEPSFLSGLASLVFGR